MCGFNDWLGRAEHLDLDNLPIYSVYWAMRARHQEMGGEDVRQLRRKMSMTQRQFADVVGVDPITVSRWEREQTKVSTAYVVLIQKRLDDLRGEARQEKSRR